MNEFFERAAVFCPRTASILYGVAALGEAAAFLADPETGRVIHTVARGILSLGIATTAADMGIVFACSLIPEYRLLGDPKKISFKNHSRMISTIGAFAAAGWYSFVP